jgi:anti-anti-sigma regulatory factor
MAAHPNILRVHQQAQTITFQVEGWGTMTQGPVVRRLAEQRLAAGATAVRLDLRRCTYMDSTFIGILLCLQRTLDGRRTGAFVLVSPSAECRELLQKMMLAPLFAVVMEEESAAQAWQEVACDMHDMDALKCNVVEAHQALARLKGPAGEPFREALSGLRPDGGDSTR